MSPIRYGATSLGKPYTKARRVYIERDGKIVSPFHDIPLFANEDQTVFNMVVEIPRWTNAKIEIATGEKLNPLKQDIKKGKPRFVRNCFPYKGYVWNYGALPQTWEDPTMVNSEVNARGDNDPIDVCEIGSQVGYTGQVKQVKALGVLALLDEGEMDWKIIAIDINDPLADKVNDIHDVERYFPGLLDLSRQWLKIYKIPDGKPANEFAFGGEYKDKAFATSVILETHEAWKRLIQGKVPCKADTHDIAVTNISVQGSPYKVGCVLNKKQLGECEDIDGSNNNVEGKDDAWYFIKANL
ncbi:Inorganic pyrophosphatase [Apophysomyces sp. BC1034]|nr:Inorganic pyrophosphatase [Apophysomyces sp. BC1015]KAG0182449.1 Inorganic pyrophosphatase [Apophysomyces sp. BC1021]KAG0193651.1 Inorganic pyrophosphatase [Apophysomyces sp. BC1034]